MPDRADAVVVRPEDPIIFKHALALASLAAFSFGCAMTDYPMMPPQNKSHGIVDCGTNDRVANAQQTIETETRGLSYALTFRQGACDSPALSSGLVSPQDARDWNRFNANYTLFQEVSVDGVPSGTWLVAGVKDLPDGSTRINNLYDPSTGVFSCAGSGSDGRWGASEGHVFGDKLGRLPGLRLDSIAIDRGSASQFCQNIVAMSPEAARDGYSTYIAAKERGAEGTLAATPISRRANLLNLLTGGTETLSFDEVTITVRGWLNPDGTWSIDLLSLRHPRAQYDAISPVRFTASPANGFKTVSVENATEDEMVSLAEFAMDSGLTDSPIDFSGRQIIEFGYTFGNFEIQLNPAAISRFIDEHSPPIDR